MTKEGKYDWTSKKSNSEYSLESSKDEYFQKKLDQMVDKPEVEIISPNINQVEDESQIYQDFGVSK